MAMDQMRIIWYCVVNSNAHVQLANSTVLMVNVLTRINCVIIEMIVVISRTRKAARQVNVLQRPEVAARITAAP